MSLTAEDFGSDNPSFNVDAANAVYEWYMDADKDAADVVLNMFMSEVVSKCMEEYGDQIIDSVYHNVSKRVNVLKTTVKRNMISKSMSNEALDETIEALELVSKTTGYTTWERSLNANRQRRGQGGRFAPMGRTSMSAVERDGTDQHVSFTDNQNAGGTRAAAQLALLASPRGLKNLGQYQTAYDEISEALRGFQNMGHIPLKAEIIGRRNGQPYRRSVNVPNSDTPQNEMLSPLDFTGDNQIDSIEWYSDGQSSPYARGYIDPVAAAGRGLVGYSQRESRNTTSIGESGATRAMRHLGNVATTADEMGAGVGLKSKAAIQAGKMVGDFGPDAEKVFGPAIRRASYRYRGTERDVDTALFQSMGESMKGAKDPSDARDRLIIPRIAHITEFGRDIEVPIPSNFLKYWQNRLPEASLVDLQTNSGAIAPSEGVILTREGRPIAQSIGYGDDHYLPFNLRKLGKAKGGEYVRTRSLGGPTSEDVYAGLMSGARASTVVSHSGIFTIEYDPAFRGSRRLNDKAARMKKRYEKLLDTLDAQKAMLNDTPSDRKAEIYEQAEMEIPGDSKEVAFERRARAQELLQMEIMNPTPSKRRMEEWAKEYILDRGEEFTDEQGSSLGITQLKAEYGISTGKKIETDEELIDAMGIREDYERYVAKMTRDYQSELRPLKLNGQGYYNALKALKEQFPYYIKDVRWTPPSKETAKLKDVGYVKANHLRSKNIKEGFWDKTIEGFESDNPALQLSNGRNSGKRTADRENYANYSAYTRLGQNNPSWVREEADAERRQRLNEEVPPGGAAVNPSIGGGTTAAPVASAGAATALGNTAVGSGATPQTPATTSRASGKLYRFASGANVSVSPAGAVYGGFGRSRHQRDVTLTPYAQNRQIVALRNKLKSSGDLMYRQENGQKALFNPWDADPANPLRQNYPDLFSTMDPDSFMSSLTSDEQFRNRVISQINNLYVTGRDQGNGIESSIYSKINGEQFLNGLVYGTHGTARNPGDSATLVNALRTGAKREYDFTAGRIDGSNYLPGLSKVEYKATFMADQDIQGFLKQSGDRFGYAIGLDTPDANVFGRLVKQMSGVMERGVDKVAEMRSAIQRYGGPRHIPNKEVVKYGGKEYSAYTVDQLDSDIARDALALAKIKQLRNNYDNVQFTDVNDNVTLVELKDEETELKEQFDSSGGKKVGDLYFGRPKDSEPPAPSKLNIDEQRLEESKQKLDSLIGLDSVKDEFNSIVDNARVNAMRRNQGLPYKQPTMHLVFTGNPGTGKTTVANEIAQSYNALGLIPKDTFVSATRGNIVQPYLGQTAKAVQDLFAKGKGGVIFIDEAYSLFNGKDDPYGKEAVDEIVAQTEKNRNDTVVILAGYTGDMERLFEANPGLKSRFPKTIEFPDYSPEELNRISRKEMKERGRVYASDAEHKMADVMQRIVSMPGYSNARDGRNFQDVLDSVQNARVMREKGLVATKEDLETVTGADVDNASRLFFRQRTGSVTKRLVAL